MESTKTLLKGGTLLIHDDNDHVVPTVADLLISGSYISKISPSIDVDEADDDVKVMDCTGKIISPGFVDTHRHLWQTQLKGLHANQSLLQYLPCGNFTSSLFTPEDMFWGQLSGCMESLDAGTTTVVDHAHCNITAEHSLEAIRATVSSGLRVVFCYTTTISVTSWAPFTLHLGNMFEPWVMETFKSLASQAPFGPNGRVKLGFAFDGLYLPGKMIQGLYNAVRGIGAHLITSHGTSGAMFGRPHNSFQVLSSLDLLQKDILISHANNPAPEDAALLRTSGAHISSTPSTELQMSMGPPLALHPDFARHASLGIDCHSNNSASIPAQMNLLLQAARAARGEALAGVPATTDSEDGSPADFSTAKWDRGVDRSLSVEAAFNAGTIRGAEGAGLADEVGRLAEGYRADVVVFDGETPGMLAAAATDPVAAVVLHSSVRDVEAVFVDGVVRKEGGKLRDVDVAAAVSAAGGTPAAIDDAAKGIANGAVACAGAHGAHGDGETASSAEGGVREKLAWRDIARAVLRSRERVMREMEGIDFKAAEDVLVDLLHLNKAHMI